MKACTDTVASPNAANCTAYLSTCAFNGTACVAAAACTSYGLNSFAACSVTTDGAGNFCGWVTGGTTCKARACTDTVPSASAANCSAYLSTCVFDGSKCAVRAACASFNVTT